jgi:hypothetical protein
MSATAEIFSVYPDKSNNPGNFIKGCTFRKLTVTRKITVRDAPALIKAALNMRSLPSGDDVSDNDEQPHG